MKKVILLALFIIQAFFSNVRSENVGWIKIQTPTNSNLRDVFFLDSLTGWACGKNGCVLKTSNGGNNWAYYQATTEDLNAIRFQNYQTGYSVGTNGVILKTIDGGINWTSQVIGFLSFTFYFLQIVNDSSLYAGGSKKSNAYDFNPDMVYETTDNGINWISKFSSTGNNISVGNFHSIDSGIICGATYSHFPPYYCGENLPVKKTINGGINWTNIYPPYEIIVPGDIAFIDNSKGFLVGNVFDIHCYLTGEVVLQKTTDGGNNWTYREITELTDVINSIDFINQDTGFISGKGKIYRTTNGAYFYPQTTNTTLSLNSIYFVNKNIGYVACDSGLILKTNSGGEPVSINNNSQIVPEQFYLYQNYPNPFNPNTIINYELPFAGYITLKVTDVLGKEITTLVNQKQNAGIHEVEFNGGNLPSGVYFYKLETKGYSDTKRMILLK